MTKSVPLQTWTIDAYDPLGFCAYCGSTEGLTDEHIIPFGLLPRGGDWFLPDASCGKCACITKKFEGSVQQNMLGPLRHKMGMVSKRKKKGRKDTFKLTYNYPDGRLEDKDVAVADLPTMCLGFQWPAPRFLRNLPPTDQPEGTLVWKYVEEEVQRHMSSTQSFKIGRVYALDFARMVAKIAHVYALAKFGRGSFEPMLPPFILDTHGTAVLAMSTLVGGDATGPAPLPPEPVLHRVYRVDCRLKGVHYMMMAVRLFAFMGMPRYHVIVGKKTDQNPPTPLDHSRDA